MKLKEHASAEKLRGGYYTPLSLFNLWLTGDCQVILWEITSELLPFTREADNFPNT